MLDVVLTASLESWPDIRLARTLHGLGLPDVADWSEGGITVRQAMLEAWLRSFLAGRAEPSARGGRPPSKTAWLRENWRSYQADLGAQQTDTARTRILSTAYSRAFAGDTLTRNTIVKFLDEVMPDRVKNCQ